MLMRTKKNVPCKHDTLCQARVKKHTSSQTKMVKIYIFFKPEPIRNRNLKGIIYPYRPYKGVPPGKYKNQPGTEFLPFALHAYKKSPYSCAKHRLALSIRVSLMLS